MPTQIASTPTVKGEDAKIIKREMQRKPTKSAKAGAELILKRFKNIVKY